MNYNISKYSSNICKFIETHIKYKLNNTNFNENKIINNISLLFSQSNPIKLEFDNTYYIEQLHNTNYPLNYLLWNKLYNNGLAEQQFNNNLDIPNFNNFDIFYNWYNINSRLINIDNIYNNLPRKLKDYGLFINPTDTNRINLHNEIYKNHFVPLDVQHHIETSNLVYEKYINMIEKVSINMYYIKNSAKPDINLITRIISFIRKISNNYDLFVDLTIIYGHQRKELIYYPNMNILTPTNMNSGSTYPTRNITIFRSEELYKILIHELIHYYGFDSHIYKYCFEDIKTILEKHIYLDKKYGTDQINESYTEILAIIFHTAIMSTLLGKSFNELINIELAFSAFQVAKLINYYDGTKFKHIFKDNKNNIKICQTSSACSYYIIKFFMLFQLETMLNFWDLNGFKITKNNESEYIKLYENIILNAKENKKMKDVIKYMLNIIKTHREYKTNFMMSTMRMSALEII